MKIQKWEYKSYFDTWRDHELTVDRDLSSLGADGWELVSVVVHGLRACYYFKRPVQPPSDIVFTSDPIGLPPVVT